MTTRIHFNRDAPCYGRRWFRLFRPSRWHQWDVREVKDGRVVWRWGHCIQCGKDAY